MNASEPPFPPPERPRVRRFLAVWPPAPVVEALAPLARVPAEKLHVTLRFLGDAPFDVDACRAVRLPAATARLAATTATFGRRVLQVPVSGLDELAVAVDPQPERPFSGHLTLARSRREDLRPRAGVAVPAEAQVPWPVTEVTLVASAGGRYEVLERFPVG
jgi:2'-5' RNA ligase